MSSSRKDDKMSRKPSRAGITLFEGDAGEFDGKDIGPVSLLVAQWEGLQLLWDYERPGDELVLHATRGRGSGHARLSRKGGWGYYDMNVEENDDRAAVNVSFMNAKNEPVSLLWILDKKRRTAIRKAIDRYVGVEDPVFGD